MKRFWGPVLLVIAVAVLGACGDSARPGHSDDELLEVFLPWSDPEEQAHLEREFYARVQDLVADCMHDTGMQYVPVPLESMSYGPGTGITESEFARRFGFGVSTNDDTFAAFAASTASVGDPNQQYEKSLSTERRIVFSEERNRCLQQAHESAPQPSNQFKKAVDDLIARVAADPAVIEAEAEWATCVRGDDEMLPAFSSLDQLTSWLWGESERVKDQPLALAQLQDLERRVAVKHLECGPPLLAIMAEVGARYKSAVAADYGDLFERQRQFLDS